MTTKKNVFNEMEKNSFDGVKQPEEETKTTTPSGEVDYEKMSDVALGDKVSYVRESLDKVQTTIEKVQLFNADTENEQPVVALNDKTKKYYKASFIVTYSEKNADGVNHREYLSGCIQFVQKDGGLSEHSFWYEGATNQVAELWEKVAEFKGKEPKDLSPREFMGFLNSKPKVEIEYKMTNSTNPKYRVKKNFIGKFL